VNRRSDGGCLILFFVVWVIQDPNSLASAALKAIAAIEGDFHNALDTSYRTMGETTFKALRRHLPITRKKLEWNKIMQYKIGSELNK
jgi:capping protein alpha